MIASIRVNSRFNGPSGSANGGYLCGLMAAKIGRSLTVRLHRPIPLETDLALRFDSVSGKWHLLLDEQMLAAANVAHEHIHLHTHVPDSPGLVPALEAAEAFSGHAYHPYPECFVCGPQRRVHDGLRIFPGHMPGINQVAATWVPDARLADRDGNVAAEFIWAAMDCPGYFASVRPGCAALLGELSVYLERSVKVGLPYVVIGWQILIQGRKHKVGTALFDESGHRCAVGVATWLEVS